MPGNFKRLSGQSDFLVTGSGAFCDTCCETNEWYRFDKCPTDPGSPPSNTIYIPRELGDYPDNWVIVVDGVCFYEIHVVDALPAGATVVYGYDAEYDSCRDCVEEPDPMIEECDCDGCPTAYWVEISDAEFECPGPPACTYGPFSDTVVVELIQTGPPICTYEFEEDDPPSAEDYTSLVWLSCYLKGSAFVWDCMYEWTQYDPPSCSFPIAPNFEVSPAITQCPPTQPYPYVAGSAGTCTYVSGTLRVY